MLRPDHWWGKANKKELVSDLMAKAKQIEYLIQNLPIPEPEEAQVRPRACATLTVHPLVWLSTCDG